MKFLIWANVACFVLSWLAPAIVPYFGLSPAAVFTRLWVWQPVTYLFLHADAFHILFNMLALWMFGVELERLWGRTFFLKYYFVTGVGAAATTLLLTLVPGGYGEVLWNTLTVGASGAIYGLLLAYGLYFPDRPIFFMGLFPIPARIFVLIMGGIALLSSMGGHDGGVAYTAHLGGLVFGYLYLRVWRNRPLAEVKYRYFKWKMNRVRRKFDVYSGGRNDWDRNVH